MHLFQIHLSNLTENLSKFHDFRDVQKGESSWFVSPGFIRAGGNLSNQSSRHAEGQVTKWIKGLNTLR